MKRRRTYTTSHARRTSRRMSESTVGTHVARRPTSQRRSSDYTDGIRRRAAVKRIAVAVLAVVLVVAVAVFAGWMAFRGTVGSEMALRDSDAATALVPSKSDEPSYTLVSVELGSIAEPLETPGPDMLVLLRVDNAKKSLALVDIPGSLQVTEDNASVTMASIALKGDAALIEAMNGFAKVDISHFVKVGEEDLCNMVDALGGVEVDVDQVIDDPRASNVYIPSGHTELDSKTVLTYLRANNLKLGEQDKLKHQVTFSVALLEELFMSSGGFQAKLESIDKYFQTDCSLGDIEKMGSWLSAQTADDIAAVSLPGYLSTVAGVVDDGQARYVASSSDMASILEDLEEGRTPSTGMAGSSDTVDPSSFTVDVQNGTTIAGAAAVTGDLLASKGFNVGSVGNAEQQIYEETLVVYKGDGEARANTVIEAVGVGRPVDASSYYTFDGDVLIVIGSDYTPVS